MRRVLGLLVIVMLAGPLSAWADPSCGSVTSTGSSTPSNPQTLVATPSSTGGVWIIQVGLRDGDVSGNGVVSVTSSAGGTFTLFGNNAATGTTDIFSFVFYSTNYASGSQTLSVTYTGVPLQGRVAEVVCTNVALGSPWLGAAVTTETVATSVSIDVPCRAGGLVVDFANVTAMGAGVAPTIGAGQTSKLNVATGTDNMDTVQSTEAGASTVTMSWSGGGVSSTWGAVGGCLVSPSQRPSGVVFLGD